MGFDKTGIAVDGEVIATRAARVLREVCDPVLEVGPGVSGLRAVREEPPGAGPLAALLAGADELGVVPLLLLAVDLPFVEAGLLGLIAGFRGDGAVVPVVGGRLQLVCARYGEEAIEEGRSRYAGGERSLRWIAELAGTVILGEGTWREVASERAFADLDTPGDLVRWGLDAPGDLA